MAPFVANALYVRRNEGCEPRGCFLWQVVTGCFRASYLQLTKSQVCFHCMWCESNAMVFMGTSTQVLVFPRVVHHVAHCCIFIFTCRSAVTVESVPYTDGMGLNVKILDGSSEGISRPSMLLCAMQGLWMKAHGFLVVISTCK